MKPRMGYIFLAVALVAVTIELLSGSRSVGQEARKRVKWEYWVLRTNASTDEQVKLLDEQGGQGWELVAIAGGQLVVDSAIQTAIPGRAVATSSILNHFGGSEVWFYFKRLK